MGVQVLAAESRPEIVVNESPRPSMSGMPDICELVEQHQRSYPRVRLEPGTTAVFAKLEVEFYLRCMAPGSSEQDKGAQDHHHCREQHPSPVDPGAWCLVRRNLALGLSPAEELGDALVQSELRFQVVVEHPLIPAVLESVEEEAARP